MGAIAALVMAFGTGAVAAAVALLAVGLREVSPNRAPGAVGRWSTAVTMVVIGIAVTAISVSLIAAALDQCRVRHPLTQSDPGANTSKAPIGTVTRDDQDLRWIATNEHIASDVSAIAGKATEH